MSYQSPVEPYAYKLTFHSRHVQAARARSFYSERGVSQLGGGLTAWPGFFQYVLRRRVRALKNSARIRLQLLRIQKFGQALDGDPCFNCIRKRKGELNKSKIKNSRRIRS